MMLDVKVEMIAQFQEMKLNSWIKREIFFPWVHIMLIFIK